MAQESNFEELATELYRLLGHQVERAIKRGSQTSDLIIKASNGERWIARCDQSREVTDSTVRDFFQVLAVEKAKQAAIITSGIVTPQARELVKGKPVHLLDGKQFQAYLSQARTRAQGNVQIPAQDSPQIKAKQVETPLAIQSQHIGVKKCPYCAEEIQEAAIVCRHCGRDLRTGQTPQPAIVIQTAPQRQWSPGIAALLSLVIPGAGQIYKGKLGAGISWLFAVVIGYFLFVVPGLILHIICIFNAYSGDPYEQNKVARPQNVSVPSQSKQQRTLLPIILGLLGVLFVLCLLPTLIAPLIAPSNGASNSPVTSPTNTSISTAGVPTVVVETSTPEPTFTALPTDVPLPTNTHVVVETSTPEPTFTALPTDVPLPTNTQQPNNDPYYLDLAGKVLKYMDYFEELGTLTGQLSNNAYLIFDEDWTYNVALNLVMLDASAEAYAEFSPPSDCKLSGDIAAIIYETSQLTTNYATGVDNMDADILQLASYNIDNIGVYHASLATKMKECIK